MDPVSRIAAARDHPPVRSVTRSTPASSSAPAPSRVGLMALRRGRVARAFAVTGLVVLGAGYAGPVAGALAAETPHGLPSLDAPAFAFPAFKTAARRSAPKAKKGTARSARAAATAKRAAAARAPS